MFAVINQLSLKDAVDWAELARQVETIEARIAADHSTFRGCSLIRTGDAAAILVVSFDTREALEAISRDVAAPWFAQHVRPLLVGPVSRSVGEVLSGNALR